MASLDLHEKANFTRLGRLLVDKGTEALRNTFDSIHSPANLSAVLSANKISLLKLKPRVINDLQWDLLYPPSGSPPDSKTFDVTLLTVLFRNICGLLKTGWDAMPADSDRSMQANIVRIRLFRNEVYAHVTSTQVDNATFQSLWKKISQALVDLKISQKDIDELKTCPVGPREEEYLRILQHWKLREDEYFTLEGPNETYQCKSMESSIKRLTQYFEENRAVAKNRSNDEDLLRKLAKHNFKSKVRSKVKFFQPGTRQWLLNEVDKWFIGNEHESRIFLLAAGPGFGKSVFSAKICEDFKMKGKLGACHFCDFSNSNLRNPMMMLESLASQMCENVLGFKERLIDQLRRPTKVRSLKDAFRIYLQNPLDELELAEPILIVIDGLDETAADDRIKIVNLISDSFPDLPKFMKVLVTSRPEICVSKLNGLKKISIENYIADNDSDLKFYLKFHLRSIPDREDSGVFEKLVKMCEGSFLYAFFLQLELQKCLDLDQLMPDKIAKFRPQGLDFVYHKYCRRLEDELKAIMPGNFDVLKILEMLVASKGPLPITFIAGALGLAPDCHQTKNIINHINLVLSCLLYISDDLVTVPHSSFVDWLLANNHEFTVEVIDGDRSLWIMCEQIFKEIKDAVLSGHDPNLTNNLMYALKHGFQHLTSCEMMKSYTWLVDVVIVYNVLAVSEIDHECILKCWEDVLDFNGGLTGELQKRIKWHSLALYRIVNELASRKEDICCLYLIIVLKFPEIFSQTEKMFAESCLSKSRPQLVSIDCDREVRLKSLQFMVKCHQLQSCWFVRRQVNGSRWNCCSECKFARKFNPALAVSY